MKLYLLLTLVFSIALSKEALANSPKWYKGSIESAFSKATKESRPLFLYWGAVWCPPCNQMKKTVFRTKEFQKEMKNFISVYLDGDTEEAQSWGEKLKSYGYPTMLILNSKGEEITRLPTGIDSKSYVDLMQKARSSMTPIKKLITQKSISDDEWRMLALYSWEQDPENANTETFNHLYKTIPNKLVGLKTRILLLLLNSKAKKEDFKLSKNQKNKMINILHDEAVSFENRDLLINGFWNIAKKDKDLKVYWLNAVQALKTKKLSLREEVSLLIPKMKSYGEVESYPQDFKDEIKKAAKKVSTTAKDPYTRKSAIGTTIWLLQTTGQLDLAYKYALNESQKSTTPYYYMSYLASIEAKRKNNSKSLMWSQKAWNVAKGSAARFQWGTNHLISLFKFSADSKDIKLALSTLLAENLKYKDAFSGRNKYRYNRILNAIGTSSNKEQNKVLFTKALKSECKRYKRNDCSAWTKK